METHSDDCPPIVSGAIIPTDNNSVVVLVVDDSEDDELTAAIAELGAVPSERFGGAWRAHVTMDRTENRIKNDSVQFVLIERGGGMERCFFWPNPPIELVELLSSEAHYVALLPAEYAGAVVGDIDPEDFIPRLEGSLIAEVTQPSDAVAKLRELRKR